VIHVMQEMYDWYMDNLFGEHYKKAVKHAEKDGRDRSKRIAKGGAGQALAPVPREEWGDYFSPTAWGSRSFGEHSGISKWERIGSPFVASVVDWGLIINPYTPPKGKWSAVLRQWDRYHEYNY